MTGRRRLAVATLLVAVTAVAVMLWARYRGSEGEPLAGFYEMRGTNGAGAPSVARLRLLPDHTFHVAVDTANGPAAPPVRLMFEGAWKLVEIRGKTVLSFGSTSWSFPGTTWWSALVVPYWEIATDARGETLLRFQESTFVRVDG